MKTHLPLVISACIAFTLTFFFLQFEYQNEPVPVASGWYQDLPLLIVVAFSITSFAYGFFSLASRLIEYIKKYKGHEFANFF